MRFDIDKDVIYSNQDLRDYYLTLAIKDVIRSPQRTVVHVGLALLFNGRKA
jgi:hypothetical protein